MSCVVSVVGICASDDGLKISPSQSAQTPPNDKHVGHGDPCLYLKFLNRFNRTAPFKIEVTGHVSPAGSVGAPAAQGRPPDDRTPRPLLSNEKVNKKRTLQKQNPFKVEVTGLEPTASASRTQRSTKLSHTSMSQKIYYQI